MKRQVLMTFVLTTLGVGLLATNALAYSVSWSRSPAGSGTLTQPVTYSLDYDCTPNQGIDGQSLTFWDAGVQNEIPGLNPLTFTAIGSHAEVTIPTQSEGQTVGYVFINNAGGDCGNPPYFTLEYDATNPVWTFGGLGEPPPDYTASSSDAIYSIAGNLALLFFYAVSAVVTVTITIRIVLWAIHKMFVYFRP